MFAGAAQENHGARGRCVEFRIRFGYDGRNGESERMPHVVTKSDLVEVAAKAGNVSKTAAGEAVNPVFHAIATNAPTAHRLPAVPSLPFPPPIPNPPPSPTP